MFIQIINLWHLTRVIITAYFIVTLTYGDLINARVYYTVTGNGFHRMVNYQVSIGNFFKTNCHVALYLEIPSSLYVNIDELSNLQRVGKTTACVTGERNVELFAEEAKSQIVTICAPLTRDTWNNLSLSIHQRYQRAKYDESYVSALLPKPKLLLGCKHRIKEYQVSNIDLCYPCVKFSFKWREIPVETETEQYTWMIPIGDISSRNYVTCITLFTSAIGTIIILRSLWRRKQNRIKID